MSTSDKYAERSFGAIPVGFGKRPGIVVVDFQIGYTHEGYPFGGSPLIDRALANTQKLLEVARRLGVPVANCNTAYMDEREMPYWKITATRELMRHGNKAAEFDPRIYDPGYDLAVCKKGASIFFDTTVASYFIKNQVDTVIVTGCNTSGCIRASVVDSFNHRFRTIVPEDCVGDLDEGPHRDNLRDVERRYADVTDLKTCIEYLERCSAAAE
ncbi:MAG TPA: isochorismatase family protein [Bordetella sp.]